MSSVVESELLLHPELLSTEALIHILLERKIKIDDIGTMTRERLIEVFNQFCLPKTQRRFKDTGRSRALHKQQEERTNHPSKTSCENYPQSCPMNGILQHQAMERIKPPIANFGFENRPYTLVTSNISVIENDYDMTQSNKRKHTQDLTSIDQPKAQKHRMIQWP